VNFAFLGRQSGKALFKQGLEILFADNARIERSVNPPDQRRQVGDKCQPYRYTCDSGQTLAYFWQMAMSSHTIRLEVIGCLSKQNVRFRFAPSPGNT